MYCTKIYLSSSPADFAASVAPCTAMPICALASAGASLTPSPGSDPKNHGFHRQKWGVHSPNVEFHTFHKKKGLNRQTWGVHSPKCGISHISPEKKTWISPTMGSSLTKMWDFTHFTRKKTWISPTMGSSLTKCRISHISPEKNMDFTCKI